MSKIPYWQLLQDPRWQRKRLEILQRANFSCEDCGDSENTLSVHHSYYSKGVKPWEYDNDSLHALCSDCHELRTEAEHDLLRAVRTIKSLELWGIATTLAHLLEIGVPIDRISFNLSQYSNTPLPELTVPEGLE